MTVPNERKLPGLESKYAANDRPSGFTDPEEVWYFFYGNKLPQEFGETLSNDAKHGHLVLLTERSVSD
ncbi:MAG TPA: hypothetical protein PLZ60_12710 [Kiritimatiellia bacterium]|nr:hypothetical protein [Kiritimatiellia bacterium]HRU69503.1 hypothetical protein [Kiritimatiellia bacterium]